MSTPPKTVTIAMPIYNELFGALPEDQRTREVREALDTVYQFELKMLLLYALHPDCVEPLIALNPWRRAGAQWIAEFHVSDLSRKATADMNWHGQNTSRWCYAGAIVVEAGRVSTHH